MKALKIIGIAIAGVAGVAAIGLLLGLAVQALWNWLMPGLFHLPALTYWQAVGLFVLSHLLFASPRVGGGGSGKPPAEKCRRDDKLDRRVEQLLAEPEPKPDAT